MRRVGVERLEKRKRPVRRAVCPPQISGSRFRRREDEHAVRPHAIAPERVQPRVHLGNASLRKDVRARISVHEDVRSRGGAVRRPHFRAVRGVGRDENESTPDARQGVWRRQGLHGRRNVEGPQPLRRSLRSSHERREEQTDQQCWIFRRHGAYPQCRVVPRDLPGFRSSGPGHITAVIGHEQVGVASATPGWNQADGSRRDDDSARGL